jgi:hypothetical protein
MMGGGDVGVGSGILEEELVVVVSGVVGGEVRGWEVLFLAWMVGGKSPSWDMEKGMLRWVVR